MHAHGVDVGGAHQGDVAAVGAGVHLGEPLGGDVVGAAQEQPLAVDVPLLGARIDTHLAQAGHGVALVEHAATAAQRGLHAVEVRLPQLRWPPQTGLGQRDVDRLARVPCRDRPGAPLPVGAAREVVGREGQLQLGGLGRPSGVAPGAQRHGGGGGAGRRVHAAAHLGFVEHQCLPEAQGDIAPDAAGVALLPAGGPGATGAGVVVREDALEQALAQRPGAGVLDRAVHAHHQFIALTGAQRVRRVEGKRLEIAFVRPQVAAVQPDIGEVVDAAELQHGAGRGDRGRGVEFPAVPGHAAVVDAVEVPVRRDADVTPLCIGLALWRIELQGAGQVAGQEAPGAGEVDLAGCWTGRGCRRLGARRCSPETTQECPPQPPRQAQQAEGQWVVQGCGHVGEGWQRRP